MEGFSIQVQEEILLARESRREGNEGRARVCARRAAGAAVREYLEGRGIGNDSDNVLVALEKLKEAAALPARVLDAISRLNERVDEFHNLPPEIDLIKEAEIVIQFTRQPNNTDLDQVDG